MNFKNMPRVFRGGLPLYFVILFGCSPPQPTRNSSDITTEDFNPQITVTLDKENQMNVEIYSLSHRLEMDESDQWKVVYDNVEKSLNGKHDNKSEYQVASMAYSKMASRQVQIDFHRNKQRSALNSFVELPAEFNLFSFAFDHKSKDVLIELDHSVIPIAWDNITGGEKVMLLKWSLECSDFSTEYGYETLDDTGEYEIDFRLNNYAYRLQCFIEINLERKNNGQLAQEFDAKGSKIEARVIRSLEFEFDFVP